jgi:hypothetical protein
MGQPIPAQHPSVVLRSHFKLVRTLLILAVAALLASTAALVIVANDDDQVSSVSPAAPALQPQTQPGTRFDGGPEEGTRGMAVQPQVPAGTRFDGGPEEGTRGARSYYDSPTQRSSYQPAPADGFKDRAGGPRMIPQGPAGR